MNQQPSGKLLCPHNTAALSLDGDRIQDQGVELPAEGLIHVDTLGDDFDRYDSASHSLAGYRSGNKFRLGDVIRVEVAHVNIERRELDFRVVKKIGHAGGLAKRKRIEKQRRRRR